MHEERLLIREKRYKIILKCLQAYIGHLVIVIKANTPGDDKHTREARFLVRLFTNVLKQEMTVIHEETLTSHQEGPCLLLVTPSWDATTIKQALVMIEDTHPLGRLIDLDVYQPDGTPLARTSLGYAERSCFLCEQPAHICVREQRHDMKDLVTFIHDKVHDDMQSRMTRLIDEVIMLELDLEHKFGLVERQTSGAHHDMNHALMIKAKDAIIPHLVNAFLIGLERGDPEGLLERARSLGIAAEQAMLTATAGVNCYKGLIFVLGLVLLATGVVIHRQEDMSMSFSHIKTMTKDILHEFDDHAETTSGIEAFEQYGIRGVRGEVHDGLPSVTKALSLLEPDTQLDDVMLRKLLQVLIVESEDTVLLKRAGSLREYQLIKDEIAALDMSDLTMVKHYTRSAVQRGLSFGGSADLLVATLFIHRFKLMMG
ncbi:MAG: citrate lyase holo-[acyl-carrier protein] synthase [Acholeplasmataceae bacterium]|nr:MAG: citrate lyase holo-[acyl-carrier protein] synthase [Acholeplasmataceae bacterium]